MNKKQEQQILDYYSTADKYIRTLLKKYLPAIVDIEIEHMGHGQYLHEHSDEYANKLIEYLQS